MRRFALLVLIFATTSGGAAAQSQTDAPTFKPPEWLRRPTAQDLLSVWPAAAFKGGQGGKAVIACDTTVEGTLRGFRVLSESPAGLGFGAAAMALAPQFLMKPATKAGVPVASRVQIPVDFQRPDRALGSRIRSSTTDVQTNAVFSDVSWVSAPSHQEVMAAYPAKARAEGVGGSVTLMCKFTRGGGLAACQEAREEPAGYGFENAARALTSRFVAPLKTETGRSVVNGYTQVRVTFAPGPLTEGEPVILRPNWSRLPEPADFTAALPEAAKRAGVGKARVVMRCKVGGTGGLEACQIRSVEPAGLGFGQATVRLAGKFGLPVRSEEGLPTVGAAVTVPPRWDLDPAAKP